jgi:hypothetical protein
MWDFGQYNLVVKQVEGCSDILRDVLARHGQGGTIHSRVSKRLLKHLSQAITELDKRALRMLALYDAAAREMVRNGVHYDPRRDMFKRKPAPEQKAIEAPKKGKRNA